MKIFNQFEDLGAVFVCETWCYPPETGDILDSVSDPLERLALRDYLWWSQVYKRAVAGSYSFFASPGPLEFIEPYHVDGVVFHQVRSCRLNCIGHLYRRDLVQRYNDVPTLMLESDMCDLRDYSETDWNLRIGAFIEAVDAHKQAKRR